LTANETSFQFANDHALRAERAQLLICAAPSCPKDVRKECLQRVEELNLAIPTVVFDVKDSTGADVRDVKVWMDDELLSERLNGSALVVDPGEHRFRFEAPGRAPFETQLLMRESEKGRHQVIGWPSGTEHVATARFARKPRERTLSRQRISAIVSTGVGFVGIGLGTGFGVSAVSRKHSAQELCPAEHCPTQEGVNRWDDARTSANLATAAFIIGAVGVAGGALLWFTDSAPKQGVQVGVGPNSLQFKGTW
jgi:hypothetical protein